MKKKLLSFLVAIMSTTALWASNVITYKASEKLSETTNEFASGLHTNAFNVAISSHAFSNGTGTITFAGDVTTIGDYAFRDCSGLTSVTIPNSVTTIGYEAFDNCSGLTKTNYTGTIADWCKIEFVNYYSNPTYYSKNLYINDVEVKDLVIPEGVDTIGSYAFPNCSSLISVTIPSSVTTIGNGAFDDCDNLTKTNYTGTIADWCRIVFVGISSNPTYYSNNLYINDVEVKDLVILEGVNTINNYAFYNCSGLTSVTIPSSVTTIGMYAFGDCSAIRTITCYAVNPPTCGIDVFYNVSQYAKAYVPASSLEDYQFAVGWRDLNLLPISDTSIETLSTEQIDSLPSKFMMDGQVYIRRGDKIYTLQGVEVK